MLKKKKWTSDVEVGEGASAPGHLHHCSLGTLPVEGRGRWEGWKTSSLTRSLAGKTSYKYIILLQGPKIERYFYC